MKKFYKIFKYKLHNSTHLKMTKYGKLSNKFKIDAA